MTALEVINHNYRAIKEKKAEEICDSYFKSDKTYVFVEGPRFSTLGYPAIEKGWFDFIDSPVALKEIEWVEGPYEEEGEELACVSGMVLLTAEVQTKQFQTKFRATFVMKKDSSNNWKIYHEHVSAPAPDPYGIGDWLKK